VDLGEWQHPREGATNTDDGTDDAEETRIETNLELDCSNLERKQMTLVLIPGRSSVASLRRVEEWPSGPAPAGDDS
jgi:hypothetical protein